ncbi:OmpW family protein [Burkholderia sp. Bp9017]|uniref:OmpW/AlkL family protein n=1 Tax=unclassified Burkholderia TaxID=2613784 RepID=UPI000F6044AC|nr:MULTISPECIES: OmpW family outer membrane protein [unclassified Burkholderia]RQZ31735.1 OmpW family protein [Burkholderia sp. Bp9017]RQZ37867.1 OmpW family protein [Burkholderia sp. Bp9016]
MADRTTKGPMDGDMMRRKSKVGSRPAKAVAAAVLLGLAAVPAHAQSSDAQQDGGRWWVRAGAAWVAFDENADLTAGGQAVPGGNAKVKDNAAFLVEAGYRLTPNLSVGLTVGYPPTTTLTGTGTVSGVGTIGKVKYAPAALTLQYQFSTFAKYNLYPYVGAGITYMKVFDTSDGTVTDFQARNAWGGLAQVGLEYRISRHVGVFVDVKKFIVRTSATGYLGPAPVHAAVRLDPLVTTAGIAFRF